MKSIYYLLSAIFVLAAVQCSFAQLGNGGLSPRSGTMGGGVTTNMIQEANQLRVDKSGNNTTAVRGNFGLPFFIITNAQIKSQPFDQISVGDGRWSEAGLDSNNVVYYFAPGALLLDTNFVTVAADGQSVFGNSAASINYQTSLTTSTVGFPGITNEVFGDGDFAYQPFWISDGGIQSVDNTFIWNNSTNDWLIFNADHVSCTNTVFDGNTGVTGGALFGIWQVKYANLHIRRVDYLNQVFNTASFFWTKGETSVVIDDYYCNGGTAIEIGLGGSLFQPLNVETWLRWQGQSIQVSGGPFCAVFGLGDSHNSIDGISIQVPQILTDGGSALLWNQGSPKLYFGTAQGKTSSTNNATATLQLVQDGTATNQGWIVDAKVTDSSAGGLLSYTGTGAATNATHAVFSYKVDQWQELSSSFVTGFSINGGTHTFDGGNMILPNGLGSKIGGSAKVIFNGVNIDTSGSTATNNNPLFLYGGGSPNVIVNGGSLLAAPQCFAINATNAVTVTLIGPRITGLINSNVTWTGFYLSNSVVVSSSGFAGNGAGLTNLAAASVVFQLSSSNIVVGTVYSNSYGAPLQVSGLAIVGIEAAVVGQAAVTLAIETVKTNVVWSQVTAIGLVNTGSMTNTLPTFIIPSGSRWKFTDVSSGAGNSAAAFGGIPQFLLY